MINQNRIIGGLSVLLALGILAGMLLAFSPVAAASAGETGAGGAFTGWTPTGYRLVTVPASEEAMDTVGAAPPETLADCTPDITEAIAYWPLDEASGATTFEDVVGTNDGTCSGDACPAADAGKVNGAFTFNAAQNDGITVAAPDPDVFDWLGTESFSIEVWVKTTQSCETANRVFIGRYPLAPILGKASWWVGCTYDAVNLISVANFNLRDTNGNTRTTTGTSVINDGTWHHIVAVRDNAADENRLYVDGNLEATTTSPEYIGTFESDGAVTMGYYQAVGSYQLSGTLDNIAIFDRVLTAEEIANHYNGGAGQSLCNDPPVANDDVLATNEDTPLDFTAAALLANDSDPDGGTPTIDSVDTTSSQGGTITDNGGGNYTYTPQADFFGTDTFTYTIIDGQNQTDTATVSVTVNPVNDPPQVTNPGDQTNEEGATVSLAISASDVDGDTLTYTANGLPEGLSINSATGVISGTISQTAASDSPYSVTVTVDDGVTQVQLLVSDAESFTWTVNKVNVAPSLTQPGNQVNAEGDVVNLQMQASDADGDTLTYSATGLPPGLSIEASGLNAGKISGTIAAGAAEFSPYIVTVTVEDPDGASDSKSFTWTINSPPEVTNPGDQANYTGDTVSLQIVASDADFDTLTYSASGLPDGLSINPTTGVISGKIASTAAGIHHVTVTVSDGYYDVEVEFDWVVTRPPRFYLPVIFKGSGG